MANFTVARAHQSTLTAAQQDVVTLTGCGRILQIAVHSTVATDIVAYRIGNDATQITAPTSGGAADDFVITGGDPPHTLQVAHLGTVVVKLVSAQTPKISIQSLPVQDV